MKIWFEYASSHSVTCVVCGKFRSLEAATEALLLFESYNLLHPHSELPDLFADHGIDDLIARLIYGFSHGMEQSTIPLTVASKRSETSDGIRIEVSFGRNFSTPVGLIVEPLRELFARLGAEEIDCREDLG